LALFALSDLTSCGDDSRSGGDGHHESAQEAVSPQNAMNSKPAVVREKNALFIIMGGYGSCRFDDDKILSIGPSEMEMAKAFRLNFSNLEQRGFKVQTIQSCFDVYNADKVRYVLSTDPKTIRHEPLDTYSADVADAIKAQPNRSIYFMGHSYGGWLTMRTALKNRQPHVKFAGLFTIDPISRMQCSSMTYLSTIFNFEGKPTSVPAYPGCDSAPMDFNADATLLMRQATNSWTNIYQTNFKYLHSSAIAHAGSNNEFQYPLESNPHTAIARDPHVWHKIRSVFDADFMTN
jgi:hypothetical protein